MSYRDRINDLENAMGGRIDISEEEIQTIYDDYVERAEPTLQEIRGPLSGPEPWNGPGPWWITNDIPLFEEVLEFAKKHKLSLASWWEIYNRTKFWNSPDRDSQLARVRSYDETINDIMILYNNPEAEGVQLLHRSVEYWRQDNTGKSDPRTLPDGIYEIYLKVKHKAKW